MSRNAIFGDRQSLLFFKLDGFKYSDSISIQIRDNLSDYVASPYVYRPLFMKLSGRVRPLFLAGGEDLHLELPAKLLCNISSNQHSFQYDDLSNDANRHLLDNEVNMYYHRYYQDMNTSLLFQLYRYYINMGYMPYCWQNFRLLEDEKINNSILNHIPFL